LSFEILQDGRDLIAGLNIEVIIAKTNLNKTIIYIFIVDSVDKIAIIKHKIKEKKSQITTIFFLLKLSLIIPPKSVKKRIGIKVIEEAIPKTFTLPEICIIHKLSELDKTILPKTVTIFPDINKNEFLKSFLFIANLFKIE